MKWKLYERLLLKIIQTLNILVILPNFKSNSDSYVGLEKFFKTK